MLKRTEETKRICQVVHLCVFSVWNLRKETEAGAEGGRVQERGGEKKERVREKGSGLLPPHTGAEVEPLARILLVMSAIWNVESLPLSALPSNGVVGCLSAPSL